MTVILQPPGSLVKFFREFVGRRTPQATSQVLEVMRTVVAGIVLATSTRRSLTAVGEAVLKGKRDKSTVSRLLRNRDLRSRDLHREAVARATAKLAPEDTETVRTWLLTLDGTTTQRGAHTKIKGAIQSKRRKAQKTARRQSRLAKGSKRSRKKLMKKASTRTSATQGAKSSKKGRETKYHTFLMGNLTTHQGVRIPLPRYTCDPKDFKRQGRPKSIRETQLDLAKLQIQYVLAMLPEGIRLVVVADSYFDCQKLHKLAWDKDGNKKFTLITPVDSGRCFADDSSPSKSNGCRIRDYGLKLSGNTFSRLDLRRGSEETACFRRYSERKPGPKDRRTYWLHHEERTVAKLGAVGVVYSWKTPVYEPRRNFRKRGFKVLICSDPSWSAENVVEYYECRWTAIEILIRELKQYLGFNHYTGQSLDAMERWIDLVLISFLYLEMQRYSILDEDQPVSPDIRERAKTARTLGMQNLVRTEANGELPKVIRQSYRSDRKKRLVKRFFEKVMASPGTGLSTPATMIGGG